MVSQKSQSWLDAVGSAVQSGFSEFLDKRKGAPAAKKVKAGAKASSSTISLQSLDGTGISEEAASWVQQCCSVSIQASTQALASQVDRRFVVLENQVSDQDMRVLAIAGDLQKCQQQLREQQEEIDALKSKSDEQNVQSSQGMARLSAMETRNPDTISTQALKEAMESMDARIAANEQRQTVASSSGAASSSGDMPYERRTLVRVGNLGWDCDAITLCERFTTFMAAIEILPSEYDKPVAPHRGGSHVDVLFDHPNTVAKGKLRALAKQYSFGAEDDPHRKKVWIDAKKTREEMRPARIIHRSHAFLETLIKESHPNISVIKDLIGKRVLIAGKPLCFSLRGELKCTAEISKWIDGSQQEQLTAYATAN